MIFERLRTFLSDNGIPMVDGFIDALSIALSKNQQRLTEANFSAELNKKIERLSYKNHVDGNMMSAESLHNFLQFWILIKETDSKTIEPDVFLCPNGNIQAEWYKNSKRHLVIEFGSELAICVFINGEKIITAKENALDLANTFINHSDRPLRWQ